ncbi:MAG TPA: PLDc N-terminal domain-containing protein [Solirubrobacter sp.]
MTLFWVVVIPIVVVIVALTLYDMFRHHLGGGRTALWCLLIVVLPVIGSLIWWAARKPIAGEVEATRMVEAELRAQNQRRPADGTGL